MSKGALAAYAPGAISDRSDPDLSIDQPSILTAAGGRSRARSCCRAVRSFIAGDGHDRVGDTIDLVAQHGPPATVTMRIVGIAASVSTPEVRAWMSPSDLAGFVPAGSAPNQTMLYRVANPDSQQSLAAVHDAITASLPDGAVASTQTGWRCAPASTRQPS